MEPMIFDDWYGPLRTLVVGVLAYFVVVAFLRISGTRTLSKMNAFDFVVTVALGSTLATILLSENVTLTEGAVALGVLVALQFVVTWSSVRTRWVRRLVTGEPYLLALRGDLLPEALRRARVTSDEVHSAVRASGVMRLRDVEAVVLETDGSFSVVRRPGDADAPDRTDPDDDGDALELHDSSLQGVDLGPAARGRDQDQ